MTHQDLNTGTFLQCISQLCLNVYRQAASASKATEHAGGAAFRSAFFPLVQNYQMNVVLYRSVRTAAVAGVCMWMMHLTSGRIE